MINCDSANSSKEALSNIKDKALNCPALVRLVSDIITATSTGTPLETAIIPNVKDTDKYPKPIGMPSFNPCEK